MPAAVGTALILAAVWLLVWQGSLDGVFHFDDYGNVVDNERIRSLWPLDPFLKNNRPIGLYSFALNWHFGQDEPFPYHVVNLAIHVANGLLLFIGYPLAAFLYRQHWMGITNPRLHGADLCVGSLIATAWVIHPLTTQAVTNIVQRYESLATLGYLGVWVGVLLYLLDRRVLGCLAVVSFAWIGLLSKEVFATAPLSVLLFDRLITRERWWLVVKKRWGLYGLMLTPFLWFVPMVSRFLNPTRPAIGSTMGFGIEGHSSWEYFRTQPEIIWHYIGLVLWPQDLCFDYVWRIQSNPRIYLTLGGLLVSIIGLAAMIYLRATTSSLASFESGSKLEEATNAKAWCFKWGLASWLVLTFFFILAPTSSVIPIADLAFEHRMYFASSCLIALIILAGGVLLSRLQKSSEKPAVLAAGTGLIILGVLMLLGYRTHLRNLDYRSELQVWQTAIDASPQNPRAWYGLGQAYARLGRKDLALQPMIRAVGYSNTPVSHFDAGLGECLSAAGRLEDAARLYMRALERKPNDREVMNDLGVVYLRLDQLDQAKESLEAAVEMGYSLAKYNLALVHWRQGNAVEAIASWEDVLPVDAARHASAWRLAWVFATSSDARIRDVDRAERLLREHYDLGHTLASVPDGETDSERFSDKTKQDATENAYVLDAWAATLAAQGHFNAAVDVASQALRIAKSKPNESLLPELADRLAGYRRDEPCIDGVQP
ncbi:MAG: tetratricopeptide repeat protein [Planctomycetota bacterium]